MPRLQRQMSKLQNDDNVDLQNSPVKDEPKDEPVIEKVKKVKARCEICGFETKADLRKNGCPKCGHAGLMAV